MVRINFCPNCGDRLSAVALATKQCSICKIVLDLDTIEFKFCPNCRGSIQAGICDRCGIAITALEIEGLEAKPIARPVERPDPVRDNIKKLASEDPTEKVEAANMLKTYHDSRAIGPLIDELGSSTPEVKYAVITALGALRANTSVELLMELVSDTSDWKLRSHAIHALGQIGNKEANPKIIKALTEDDREEVRQSAASALLFLPAPEVLEPLVKAIEDTAIVRKAAASTLVELRDAAAVQSLVPLLKSKDPEIRAYAALVLGELGDSSAVPELLQALESATEETRGTFIDALLLLGDKRGIGPVMRLLPDLGSILHGRIIEALTHYFGVPAEEDLLRLKESEEKGGVPEVRIEMATVKEMNESPNTDSEGVMELEPSEDSQEEVEGKGEELEFEEEPLEKKPKKGKKAKKVMKK